MLTWNSARYVRQCIKSLLDTRSAHEVRVIVVDNGSHDETLDILFSLQEAAAPSQLTIIPLGRNYGTTMSRNIAIRSSRDDYFLIMDSDARVTEGALDLLVSALEQDQQVGIAAPRLFYPDGSVQNSCKRFPILQEKGLKAIPLATTRKRGEEMSLYGDEVYAEHRTQDKYVDYCISAAWLVRRETFETAGLFDEQISYAPEDVDFCVRAQLAGWRVLYVPRARFVHHTQRISYKDMGIAFRHIRGLLYYFRKYRYCLSRNSLYDRLPPGRQ